MKQVTPSIGSARPMRVASAIALLVIAVSPFKFEGTLKRLHFKYL